jgi:hypothetical protein
MKKLNRLGFENMRQVVIATLVFGGMIGFVMYGIVVNII